MEGRSEINLKVAIASVLPRSQITTFSHELCCPSCDCYNPKITSDCDPTYQALKLPVLTTTEPISYKHLGMPNPSTFIDFNRPIGIAATQDGLLLTTLEGHPAIFKVTDTKTVSVFAPTFLTAPGEVKKRLDVNPGLGSWAEKVGFVYVTQ